MEEIMNKDEMILVEIGTVKLEKGKKLISINNEYADALLGLEGFSHMLVFWWGHKYAEYRFKVEKIIDLPYAPGIKSGLFSTRSPVRYNPICVSVCDVKNIRAGSGIIEITDIDASENSPVIDIKPYYGVTDRVKEISTPEWVPADWPQWWEPEAEEVYD
jgi:tRNA (adenine37-N6)-methyltransferase